MLQGVRRKEGIGLEKRESSRRGGERKCVLLKMEEEDENEKGEVRRIPAG